jgi:hypothetical protein
VTWECTVSDGSDCTPTGGTGSTISTTATIPVGGTARVDVTVTAAQVGHTTNTAIVEACAHCTDSGGPQHAGAAGTEIGKPILPISGQSLRRVADVAGIVLIVGLILLIAPKRLRRHT